MPPVFGPAVAVAQALVVARRRAAPRRGSPSQIAMTLASRPVEPLLDHERRPSAGRPSRNDGASSSASSTESVTITPLPAARPSALRTTPAPVRGELSDEARAPPRPRRRRTPGARAIRTPAASATSWQNAFDVSIRAAARVGPNTGIPAASSASATPAASGASGPTTTSSTASARASATTAGGSSGSTAAHADPRLRRDPGAPRRDDHLVDARLARRASRRARARARRRRRPGSGRGRQVVTRSAPPQAGSRAVAHRPPGPLDGLGPLRPDRDEHDRHAGELLERRHVAAGGLGQVGQRPDVVDRLLPALEVLVDRRRARRARRPTRATVDPPAVDLVGDAQLDRLDARQDVELVEHDAADAVDGDRVAQRHRVEPADAPRPAGRRCRTRGRARAIPSPISSWSSVGNGPEPTRVE